MFELDMIALRLQSELGRVRATGAEASASDWVDLAGSCQQLINVVAAMQTVALAHVAATEDVVREDGTIEEEFRGLGHQRLDAPALLQDLLGLTASGATDRVATAVDLVTRHPALVEAMGAGRLDAYRAGIVAQELADATPQVCAEVVERIGSRLSTEAGGALRRRVRRVLGCVDADLVRRKAERERAERSLRRCAFAAGVDEWSAKVPVEESRTAWSVVDGLARRYLTEGRCTGIERARADALMDLIHARATGEITVHLTVPASEVARDSGREPRWWQTDSRDRLRYAGGHPRARVVVGVRDRSGDEGARDRQVPGRGGLRRRHGRAHVLADECAVQSSPTTCHHNSRRRRGTFSRQRSSGRQHRW